MDTLWYFSNHNFTGNNSKTTNYSANDELPLLDALEFWPWQIILITLYSVTAALSLGFNLITIVVLLKGDRISSELWKFLINLSVSDITMSLLSIPFTYTSFMLNRWIFPLFLCPVVYFAQICSVFVSVWTLTIIGIDRYIAIVHPMRELTTVHEWLRSHRWFMIGTLWFMGICTGFSQIIDSRAVPFKYGNDIMYDCREQWDEETGKIYTIIIFMVTFAIPMVILIFVYSSIGFHVWRNVIPGNPDQQRDETRGNRKDKVIKILVMIVVLFALCWLPIHIFQLLVWFYPKISRVRTKLQYRLYIWSYFACHWLSMAHSFVNPIVYCFMSDNFRINLKSVVSVFLSRLKCGSINDNIGKYDESETTQKSQAHSICTNNKIRKNYRHVNYHLKSQDMDTEV